MADGQIEELSSSEGMPELEPAPATAVSGSEGEPRKAKQSKAEKKVRKAVSRLNLQPVPGVQRVAMVKQKTIMFVVDSPDVYASSAGTYVVFGEPQIEDLSQQAAQQNAAAVTDAMEEDGADADLDAGAAAAADEPEDDDDDEDFEVPEEMKKDVELVVKQAKCSKKKAYKALMKNDGDIVNAIMDMTTD